MYSLHQQLGGPSPPRPDLRGKGSGEEAIAGRSFADTGAAGRSTGGEQPSAEASSARADR